MNRPVPAALAKRGITHVRDNIPEGMEIGNLAPAFVTLFRTEIEAKLRRLQCARKQSSTQTSGSSSCPSE